MNWHDFETNLRRQSWRSLPPEWRADILGAVEPHDDRVLAGRPASLVPRRSGWHEWLWPCPHAWAGVAAAWLVIWGLNWGATDVPRIAGRSMASPPGAILKYRQEQQQLLAGLWDAFEPEPARPAAHRGPPKPSSARRADGITA